MSRLDSLEDVSKVHWRCVGALVEVAAELSLSSPNLGEKFFGPFHGCCVFWKSMNLEEVSEDT